MLAEVADRWRPDNANNTVPVYDGYVTNDIYSRFVEDGSFLRIKNVTLGYTISDMNWLDRLGMDSIAFTFSAYNLLTFSPLKIIDPEGQTTRTGDYPLVKLYNFGLNINF